MPETENKQSRPSSFSVFLRNFLDSNDKNNISMVANGMVYSTLMTLVPCAAIFYFICDRLGAVDQLMNQLGNIFIDALGTEVGNRLMEYLDMFTRNAMALGITGILSFLVLFVILLDKVWVSINRMFHKSDRPRFVRRYIGCICFTVIFLALLALIVMLRTRFGIGLFRGRGDKTIADKVFGDVLPWFIVWVMVLCLYYFVPHCKVRFANAVVGSALCTACLLLLTRIFRLITKYMVRFSIIYGSLASIIFFLLFLSFMWKIVLYCAVFTDNYRPGKTHLLEECSRTSGDK